MLPGAFSPGGDTMTDNERKIFKTALIILGLCVVAQIAFLILEVTQ